MMGITEVNPLPAHYRCAKCQTSLFLDEEGKPYGADYSSGFDLPDKICPNCGNKVTKIKIGGRGTYYCPKCQKY